MFSTLSILRFLLTPLVIPATDLSEQVCVWCVCVCGVWGWCVSGMCVGGVCVGGVCVGGVCVVCVRLEDSCSHFDELLSLRSQQLEPRHLELET